MATVYTFNTLWRMKWYFLKPGWFISETVLIPWCSLCSAPGTFEFRDMNHWRFMCTHWDSHFVMSKCVHFYQGTNNFATVNDIPGFGVMTILLPLHCVPCISFNLGSDNMLLNQRIFVYSCHVSAWRCSV